MLQRQEIIGLSHHDSFGDGRLAAHGVNGDQGSGERQAFEQQRNGGDLVGLVRRRLLAKHQALARSPS